MAPSHPSFARARTDARPRPPPSALLQPKLDPISQDLSTSISKQQAKEDASSAAEHLRTVVALFIQNAEFRKVVFDLGVVGRDV